MFFGELVFRVGSSTVFRDGSSTLEVIHYLGGRIRYPRGMKGVWDSLDSLP